MAELEYLSLYSKNCLDCKYLIEGASKEFDCHYSNGNTLCPASELRIVITGKASKYIKRIKKARKDNDAAKEARVWEAVAKETRAFQSRFYQELSRRGLT